MPTRQYVNPSLFHFELERVRLAECNNGSSASNLPGQEAINCFGGGSANYETYIKACLGGSGANRADGCCFGSGDSDSFTTACSTGYNPFDDTYTSQCFTGSSL